MLRRTIGQLVGLGLVLCLVAAGVGSGPAAATEIETQGVSAEFRNAQFGESNVASRVAVQRAAARAAAAAPVVPQYDHVVVVIMENHSADNIIANPAAPYINSLAATGASMTQSYGVTHPSQPNYFALFSGSLQDVFDNSCPQSFAADNLGAQLFAAGKTFVGYSETMPSAGYAACGFGAYARKHNPWVNFSNVPASSNQPLTSLPTDWSTLPTVSMVVPDLQNDMHDGTIGQADTWLHDRFDGYLQWAKQNNSLLILTWDEDDNNAGNRIPTIFAGAGVRAAQYPERINHYNVLRTLQDMYGLPPLANSVTAGAVVDIWDSSPINQPPVAAITGSCTQLVCSVSGTTSSDNDGLISTYTWDWGDGATASGPTASHTFSTPGAKTVTLMVTDNLGSTNTTSTVITATGAVSSQPFAADAFARTRLTGWGTADVGGPWSVSSTPNSSVAPGAGNLTVGLGQTNTALLPTVSSSDSDLQATFVVDKVPTGGGIFLNFIGRRARTNLDYVGRVMVRSDAQIGLVLTGAAGATLKGQIIVPGVTSANAAAIKVRVQVTGTSPTTIRAKAWQATGTEPAAWQQTITDSAAGMQAAGSVGIAPYLSSSSTVTPITLRFSNFSVRPANQTPTAAFTGSCTLLACTANGSGSSDPDGTISSYAWNWGDGAAGSGANPSHTYPSAGSKTVTLTVTDDRGAISTVSHVLTPAAPANLPPAAAFTTQCTNLSCAMNGAGSTDPDGIVAGYSWDFGDGTQGTGVAPGHDYAAPGTYPVTLTVTDNVGATGTLSHQLVVTAPATAPPVASFTVTCAVVTCTADGTGSSDPDGTVDSYHWAWGDGSTSTGRTPAGHQYVTGGHYVITLTVTDNAGATASTSRAVDPAPPANQPPTAAASGSCANLTCSVNAAGSVDPDGTILSYSWNWGDGTAATTGPSAVASHPYATAGQRTVVLTVTDNQGATGTKQLTLTPAAPIGGPFAADAFNRTRASGWGTADVGGAWTVVGTATRYPVSPGTASMIVPAGQSLSATLASLSSSDSDIRMTLSSDKLANGNGVYVTVIGRRASATLEYQGKVRLRSDGTVAVGLGALTGTSTAVTLRPDVVPSGVSVAGGGRINVRLQVTGTAPTTIRLKVWNVGATEPAAWQVSTTDSTAALQKPGSIALMDYLSSSSTVTPVTLKVSDFSARPVTGN